MPRLLFYFNGSIPMETYLDSQMIEPSPTSLGGCSGVVASYSGIPWFMETSPHPEHTKKNSAKEALSIYQDSRIPAGLCQNLGLRGYV